MAKQEEVAALDFDTELLMLPVVEWKVRQVVIFDWYDGPRAGVASFSRPFREFQFELLDERHNPDGMDDRLLLLSELPKGTVASILSLLSDIGSPVPEIWVPVWRFPTVEEQRAVENELSGLLAMRRMTSIAILTQDMRSITGCWLLDGDVTQRRNWIEYLGIE